MCSARDLLMYYGFNILAITEYFKLRTSYKQRSYLLSHKP